MPQQTINLPRDTTIQSIVSQLQAIASALNIDWNTITGKPSNIAFYGDPVATESVAPIDPYLQASDVVDNFTDGGTDVPLSAECGKLLNNTLAGVAYGTVDNKIMWCTSVKTCMIKFADGTYTANANGIIATLPANCKPYVAVDFRDSYSQKRLQINTDGEIITVEALSNTIIRGTVTYILS